MEVGPHGILQTVADAVKLVGKELITPRSADWKLFVAAPGARVHAGARGFSGPSLRSGSHHTGPECRRPADFRVFHLYDFRHPRGRLGIQHKYALLGAIRSVAQGVAYEIPLLLSVMSIVLMVNTLRFSEIVQAQGHVWFVFLQPLAALIYLVCATAETNRTPFDIPEAESELIAGFHTEYSGMRFGLFFLAEYTNMFIVGRWPRASSWRMARALRVRPGAAGHCLVSPEDLFLRFSARLDALDVPAGPLRSVDELLVEGVDPVEPGEPAGYGGDSETHIRD